MSVTAFIPVKCNSSRVPGKNILPFAKTNLLVHKIRQLKEAADMGAVSEIIVSSDSDEMLFMAENEKVIAIKRPSDLADESRPFGDFVEYAVGYATKQNLMWTPVTSPFLNGTFYSLAVDAYEKARAEGYDSLTTVIEFHHFLFDNSGPYNFSPEKGITNSQDLPDLQLWTCGCSIIPSSLALKKRYIFGSKPYRLCVSQFQAIDIDTIYDYKNALEMWRHYNEK